MDTFHIDFSSILSRNSISTRSIDVDLTFIADEQRLSIKNVLETNNDSSEKGNEKDDSNSKESLVHTRHCYVNRSNWLEIHPRYTCSLLEIWKKF